MRHSSDAPSGHPVPEFFPVQQRPQPRLPRPSGVPAFGEAVFTETARKAQAQIDRKNAARKKFPATCCNLTLLEEALTRTIAAVLKVVVDPRHNRLNHAARVFIILPVMREKAALAQVVLGIVAEIGRASVQAEAAVRLSVLG